MPIDRTSPSNFKSTEPYNSQVPRAEVASQQSQTLERRAAYDNALEDIIRRSLHSSRSSGLIQSPPDGLWSRLMMRHHDSAVTMSTEASTSGVPLQTLPNPNGQEPATTQASNVEHQPIDSDEMDAAVEHFFEEKGWNEIADSEEISDAVDALCEGMNWDDFPPPSPPAPYSHDHTYAQARQDK